MRTRHPRRGGDPAELLVVVKLNQAPVPADGRLPASRHPVLPRRLSRRLGARRAWQIRVDVPRLCLPAVSGHGAEGFARPPTLARLPRGRAAPVLGRVNTGRFWRLLGTERCRGCRSLGCCQLQCSLGTRVWDPLWWEHEILNEKHQEEPGLALVRLG